MRILVIEDEAEIAENLAKSLEAQGYAVDVSANVAEGTEKILGGEYDMLIADRRLPDGDGLMVVDQARVAGLSIPVLILTAKSQKSGVVTGLDSGADDYLAKPFEMTELLARVRALMRRRKRLVRRPTLIMGKLTIDTNSHVVQKDGKVVLLSPKEYAVLEYLAEHPNMAVERLELMTHVWDEEVDLFSNTVDVHVRYLRRKLGQRVIQTVRGKGYMLCPV